MASRNDGKRTRKRRPLFSIWPGRRRGRTKRPAGTKAAPKSKAKAKATRRRGANPPPRTPNRAAPRGRRSGWRRPLQVIAVAAGVALVGGAAWGLERLATLPYFTVHRVEVVATGLGGPGMDRETVERRYLTPHLGEPIFSLDLAALRGEVETNPWVAEATVSRRLPDGLLLRVRLREAAAVATSGNRAWLLDRQGRVIVKTKGGASAALPQIRLRPSQRGWSDRPEAMYRCLPLAEAIRHRRFPAPDEVRCLELDERGDPVIVAAHKEIEILMGRGGYGDKLDRLAAILPDLIDTHRKVARIDLRFKDQAVVQGPG